MKAAYVSKNFKQETLYVIQQAEGIIREYQADGYDLTLRQLYYQFVARDLIPNHQKQYDRLGRIISDARLAGLIDWDAIVDRGRTLKGWKANGWAMEDPQTALEKAARIYKEDLWEDQPWRIEVWIEKEALIGVVQRVCQQYRVDYFACKGYVSQSALYKAGRRMMEYAEYDGQQVLLIHLADHDPSGIDMTRDNTYRVNMFGDNNVFLKRIALNMDQVEQYNPPPNPAKEDDSRFRDYWELYGDKCWELDALEPSVIASLIREEITDHIDPDKWKIAMDKEEANRDLIHQCSSRWDEVKEMLHQE